ncbi:MAG: hypothetical protein EA360_02170 [Balneolaceae bacterium]|nr:MAG: hypothetical protein EA360_02170 [Balneolaceae bacterium]
MPDHSSGHGTNCLRRSVSHDLYNRFSCSRLKALMLVTEQMKSTKTSVVLPIEISTAILFSFCRLFLRALPFTPVQPVC